MLLRGYLDAKHHVIQAGFEDDIIWAESLHEVTIDAYYVARETAWVILNSGFRYKVARKLWPAITEAFHGWDLERIDEGCVDQALDALNHKGKIGAMLKIAQLVRDEGVDSILEDALDPPKLTRLPFIGKTTCWHLAKVLGVDCIKPDVHLQRAAKAAGFEDPVTLCQAIQTALGEPLERLTVIDSVLWRYGEQKEARGWSDWDKLWDQSSSEIRV